MGGGRGVVLKRIRIYEVRDWREIAITAIQADMQDQIEIRDVWWALHLYMYVHQRLGWIKGTLA
jgi:hypothetical protein